VSDHPIAAHPAKRWSGASLLKVLLFAQCALGVLVVIADLPGEFLAGLPGADPRSPEIDVPIAPGNQTRRFEPDRVTRDLPATPGFSVDETMPSRLEFTEAVEGLPEGAVLVNGTIADGDAERFADWLQQRPDLPVSIALNSPGGSVSDALAIGRLIRDRDLPVVIASGAVCFSACPYVLAGGRERAVSKTAFVGVHQHYFGENTYLPAFLLVSDIQSGQGEVMAFLGEMGIDPMMMAKALMTPPDDIYILLPEELEAFRLATELTD
jgi:hypothetical protein